MEVIVNETKMHNKQELHDARMKLASKNWLYETGVENCDNFSDVFTSKDEKKVHKEEKKNGRNYTCRYRRENGTLVVEYYEFGMWN
jgi:hypothetical protein